jgi:poly(3-hydroxybutyrate) depolymerase
MWSIRVSQRRLTVATTLALPLAIAPAVAAPAVVPSYSISGVYVAGVSSGGYLATQLHVAYSGTVRGAAIFAAGPWLCAQGSLTQATLACTNNLAGDQLSTLEQTAADYSAQGRIDPIGNLSGDPAYVYHGTNDSTVKASVSADLVAFYRHFGVTVTDNSTEPAGHSWVSPRGPNPCSTSYSPYINRCGTDPEGGLLRALLGTVNAPNTGTLTGSVVTVNQNSSAPGGSAPAIDMDASGYAYVPGSCAGGASCRLLVALHGCLQGHAVIGNQFIDTADLNQYADTNALVVLYPQAIADWARNPQGCWDWWGYLGANYAQRGAPQMATIMAMVHAFGG